MCGWCFGVAGGVQVGEGDEIMKAKHKEKGFICTVQKLNPSAINPAEFIAVFDDGTMSSEYCKDYEPIDFKWDKLYDLQ